MRRFFAVLLTFILIFALAVTVSADTAASNMTVHANVGSDGVCQVTVNVSLRLEQNPEDLTFPVPKNADHVSLGGSRVRTRFTDQAQLVSLEDVAANSGEFHFTLTYNLTDVIQTSEAGTPQLQLELMSGFAYPIEQLEFTVNLPGEVTAKPAFSSGYHQASIEQDLSATFSGNTVTGRSTKILKDHETLVMMLDVSRELFPDVSTSLDNALFDDIAMLVCAVLALMYWLLFLRAAPMKPERASMPPAGFSGGELGSILTMQGADLNMMILTWAQLGYVLIQLDRNDRVLLHKRMDMGNERCGFEQKCFRALFGSKRVVDTSTQRYAMLCEKYKVLSSNVKPLLSRRSGNPRLFRILCAGIGTFGGAAIGIALGTGAVLQWFWVIVLATLGTLAAWHIHPWANGLFTYDKTPVYKGLLLSLCWVLMASMGGVLNIGILVAASQLLAGLMACFGGKRTDFGRQAALQTLGFRRYLKKLERQELHRIMSMDPDFFHSMLPYALALGVDKAFARQCGNQDLAPCSYLTYGMDSHKTPAQWSALMRKTVSCMDRRRRQMPLERLQKILDSLKK